MGMTPRGEPILCPHILALELTDTGSIVLARFRVRGARGFEMLTNKSGSLSQ